MNTLSGVLFFVAFLPYIWAIINYETIPSPVSWAIWASVDTLVLVAMKKERASIGQITGAVAGAWVITTLAIIFGKPTMGSIEWVSIAGAALGVIIWQKTGNAVLAVVCSQLATFVGAFPTFANGYANPSQENPIAWTIWLVSCICALFAIKKWNLAEALQPVTFTVIETVMVVLVVIRPHWLL
ncbi:MAG: hypothetical protein NTV02_03995 [Candidatus Zambryskibacteria bacterium]|nr:hypothetical protein [Candidatus Zambryskibacteria bacterium]